MGNSAARLKMNCGVQWLAHPDVAEAGALCVVTVFTATLVAVAVLVVTVVAVVVCVTVGVPRETTVVPDVTVEIDVFGATIDGAAR